MTPEAALADCEATVRRFDPDRYFASLFAPADRRPLLHVLYAFNHEIARAGEVAREPMMAEMRLQWWREAAQEARDGCPRAHPAAIGLAELFARAASPHELFDQLIDAHALDSLSAPFSDLPALESYAAATSGSIMRIAASVLDESAGADGLAREAGTAYGLCGILRALPFHAARGKHFLPTDLLAAEGQSLAIAQVAACAASHFARARQIRIPGRVLAAVLPASLVPSYLSRIAHRADPLRDPANVSLFRRQTVLLRAALLGRL